MLQGKTVMITGASSGIGAAAAVLFAREGAAVSIMARRAEQLDGLVKEITAEGGRALAVCGDVTRQQDVADAVARTVDTFGGLQAAFNNAGYATAGLPVHEMDDETYDRTMDVNVRGVWNCLKHQVPAMLAGGRGGSVVNTSSTAGMVATGASTAYVAAKHAVIGMTKGAALDYGDQGIRVNALVVGATRTEMLQGVLDASPHLEQVFMDAAVQKRLADPVEVARAAAWLCSDLSSFVTGAAVPVDGGVTTK
ncbi:SDR family NAD(P)-dependent oxidoreductase [Streptomyces sp. NPDC050085]